MPLQPTTPVTQPALNGQFVILGFDGTLEPSASMRITYAAIDAQGNIIPSTIQTIRMNAAGLAAAGWTVAGFRASLYAALQAEVPALAGTVT